MYVERQNSTDFLYGRSESIYRGKILQSEMRAGFFIAYEEGFPDTSDPIARSLLIVYLYL